MDLKKVKRILNILCILILILFFVGLLGYHLTYIPAVILTIFYVVLYWKKWRCPKCGKLLGRNFTTRCPYCGEDVGVALRFF